jgi:hypothetical protein
MWRLRNSTWQGTHNVPCHGTRTVLVDFPSSSRAARRANGGTAFSIQRNHTASAIADELKEKTNESLEIHSCPWGKFMQHAKADPVLPLRASGSSYPRVMRHAMLLHVFQRVI